MIRAAARENRLALTEFAPQAPAFGAGVHAADLALAAGVTAVVAYNDLMAIGMLRAAVDLLLGGLLAAGPVGGRASPGTEVTELRGQLIVRSSTTRAATQQQPAAMRRTTTAGGDQEGGGQP